MINFQNCMHNHTISLLMGLSIATILGTVQPTAATPGYDGLWSVVIVTESGTCDRAYRYPVRITKGSLVNVGESPIAISGKVVGNGAITVSVSYGDKSANGYGRLSGDAGAGSWKGGQCAGTWQAERRG
jgi:hypothetical protein